MKKLLLALLLATTANADNITVYGDSHWAPVYEPYVAVSPVAYLRQWGHTVECECLGARALIHWNSFYWKKIPYNETVVFALMSNDIMYSSVMEDEHWFHVYAHIVKDKIRESIARGNKTVYVLPTLAGLGPERRTHIWRWFLATGLSREFPTLIIVDAQASGQQPGPDGLHYEDSYLYSASINDAISSN